MAKKVVIAAVAATMLLGTTVLAGALYKMHSEPVGEYAVRTKIEETNQGENGESHSAEGQTQTIPEIKDVSMEISYLPEGMVETDEGKYSYVDALNKGGVSIVFYKMDTGDAQFDVLTTNVMEMYAASDVTKEEALKIAEGVHLQPVSGENAQNIVHAYNWSEFVQSETEEIKEGEEWSATLSVPESAMTNTHAIGESFAAAHVASPEDDWLGLGNVEIKVTDVQFSDNVSLLDQSLMDSDERTELQKEIDASGQLLPVTINYIKYGDGVNTINEVVDSRTVPQKLVYATIEYTNTGSEELDEVLFYGTLMKIAERDGQMEIYKGKASDKNAVWDEAVPQGAAHYEEMWYYDVHGGERHNNYITHLAAGSTATVHMAWLVPEEDLDYLYLDLSTFGSAGEFGAEALDVGYVDIRR